MKKFLDLKKNLVLYKIKQTLKIYEGGLKVNLIANCNYKSTEKYEKYITLHHSIKKNFISLSSDLKI